MCYVCATCQQLERCVDFPSALLAVQYVCLKEFPTGYFGSNPDYSGYDCDDWVPRGIATHRTNALAHNSARTATE